MNILVILAHPDPASFNHAIARAVCQALGTEGHRVVLHDLYAENFDPILLKPEIPQAGKVPEVIQQHCEELNAAEGIVIIHPNWWGQPPALLKGWIDRVIRPGVAYRFEEGDKGEGVPVGLLRAQTALVLNTSNTPAAREAAAFGDPLEAIWKRCIFDLCGVHTVYRRMFNVIITSTPEQRARWLQEAQELARHAFQPAAPEVLKDVLASAAAG